MLTRMLVAALCFLPLPSALPINAADSSRSAGDDKIIGRWDMTVQDGNGNKYPSWFEATRDGDKLTGRFVGRVGSQRPIRSITFEKGQLSFTLPVQYESPKGDLKFDAVLTRKQLEGTRSE